MIPRASGVELVNGVAMLEPTSINIDWIFKGRRRRKNNQSNGEGRKGGGRGERKEEEEEEEGRERQREGGTYWY